MVVEPGETGTRRTGVVMEEKKKRRLTIRLGPLGLSLLAACITAVGVAAVSMADSGSGNASNGSGTQTFQAPGPGGGVGVTTFRGPNLSAADQQKMEDFRKCMEDNGAPAPPDPGKIDPSDGPPKPPSAADREKLQKAYEACKDKLPTDMQNAGPPMIGGGKCGPPPGAPPKGTEQGQNQDQSNDSGTSSSGSDS
jgi:hypothetical protein